MIPATIIREAQADGVRLTLSPAGTIKATGERAVVNRWLGLIRQHKAEIIEALDMETSGCWLVHYSDREPLTVHYGWPTSRATVMGQYPGSGGVEPAPVRRPSAPMTADEEAAVRAYLATIGDRDPVSIADIIGACQKDADARAGFLRSAREVRP